MYLSSCPSFAIGWWFSTSSYQRAPHDYWEYVDSPRKQSPKTHLHLPLKTGDLRRDLGHSLEATVLAGVSAKSYSTLTWTSGQDCDPMEPLASGPRKRQVEAILNNFFLYFFKRQQLLTTNKKPQTDSEQRTKLECFTRRQEPITLDEQVQKQTAAENTRRNSDQNANHGQREPRTELNLECFTKTRHDNTRQYTNKTRPKDRTSWYSNERRRSQ